MTVAEAESIYNDTLVSLIESAGYSYTKEEVDEAISAAVADVSTAIPTKTSDLENDSNFVSDSHYTHTDNNFTTTEKTKLAALDGKQQIILDMSYDEDDDIYYFKDSSNTALDHQ